MATQYYSSGKKEEKSIPYVKIIGAILMTAFIIAVVYFGYTFLSKKIYNSKALSECKQAQNIIMSTVVSTTGDMDLKVNCDGVVFTYDAVLGRVVYSGNIKTNDDQLTNEMKDKFYELRKFDGSFKYRNGILYYITENGKGASMWVSGELPKQCNIEDIEN